jgi:hypothetical protein
MSIGVSIQIFEQELASPLITFLQNCETNDSQSVTNVKLAASDGARKMSHRRLDCAVGKEAAAVFGASRS